MIGVTQLDGRKMALNVDRVERVEYNDATSDTNIYLIGGSHLIVNDSVDAIIEAIVEAKSRVLARALSFAGGPLIGPGRPSDTSTAAPSLLHVVPAPGERK